MNAAEVRALLAICSSFDNRQPSEATASAWLQVLKDLDFTSARDAVVEHYTNSREWVMPADIRKLAKARQAKVDEMTRAFCDVPGCTCGQAELRPMPPSIRKALSEMFRPPREIA